MAQFMLILHETPHSRDGLSPTEIQALIEKYGAWTGKLAAAGQLVGGQKLKEEGGKAVTRAGDRLSIVDGPYAETKEVVGGYFIVKADELRRGGEALVRLAAPDLRAGRDPRGRLHGQTGAMTGPAPPAETHALVDFLFRHHAAAMLSGLSRRLGLENLDLAEEVVQEAMLQALRLWPYHGIPDNPRAWLTQVARNKALDLIRRRGTLRRKLGGLAAEADLAHFDSPVEDDDRLGDEQLAMIFACNHPALTSESRVALTLKAACGFSVPEIARAFLTPETTIAQRIVRAKKTIREDGISLEMPAPEGLPARLDSVLQVIYLLFNEGYSAHAGDALIRHDLCGEAIWLADRLARRPETATPATHALLALMLIQASRLPARQDESGDLILLPDQDRSRWDTRLIHLGLRHLDLAAEGDELTIYHLQAGIAAVHAVAPDDATTDWPRLLSLYDLLRAVDPSPVVALNRAVALAKVEGPSAGLRALDDIEGTRALEGYFLLPATRADLLLKLDRRDEAEAAYAAALASAGSEPERRFLARRLNECRGDVAPVLPLPT